jgi:HEAT repeat protein
MSGARRGAARPGAAAAILLIVLAAPLAGCAPAHDADTLFTQMQSADVDVREDAAEKLETVVRSGDYAVFLRGLESPNRMYRVQSILFLSRMDRPEARTALRGLLRVDKRSMLPYNPIRLRPSVEEADSRILVAHLIAEGGGDPEALGELLDGIGDDEEPGLLADTCFAVGALRDPKGIPFLTTAMRNPQVDVARAAVQAVGQFRVPEALETLKSAATNPSPEVRGDVLSSLDLQDGAGVLDLVRTMASTDPTPTIRAAAIQRLARSGDLSLVPFLIEQLRGRDESVRAAAQQTLQRLTGQGLAPRPEAWSRWWAQNGRRQPAAR